MPRVEIFTRRWCQFLLILNKYQYVGQDIMLMLSGFYDFDGAIATQSR